VEQKDKEKEEKGEEKKGGAGKTGPGPMLPMMRSRLFVFSAAELERLKQVASHQDPKDWISTNDALSAHIWKSVTKARGLSSSSAPSTLIMACNGRQRLIPPLPKAYFGNVNFYIRDQMPCNELSSLPLNLLSRSVRKAVNRMSDERLRCAIEWIQQQAEAKTHSIASIQANMKSFLGVDFAITSWVQFPIYDCDLGFGRPFYVGIPPTNFDGLAIVTRARQNDGSFNVVIGLKDEHMTALENDPDFHLPHLPLPAPQFPVPVSVEDTNQRTNDQQLTNKFFQRNNKLLLGATLAVAIIVAFVKRNKLFNFKVLR